MEPVLSIKLPLSRKTFDLLPVYALMKVTTLVQENRFMLMDTKHPIHKKKST
jgi:hypothetical protein